MGRTLFLAAFACLCLAAPALADEEEDEDKRIQTTREANRQDIEGAAQAPLRDLNVVRTKIPQVLVEAAADPYARPQHADCPGLIQEVAVLDEALGPDLDNPGEDPTMGEKTRAEALGFLSGAASDLIPFRSWVRKLTGAERHDRIVQEAITAGAVRRGYLKGLGEARGCHPPATPQHLPRAATPVVEERVRPRYPIR